MAERPISDLAAVLLDRQLASNPEQFKPKAFSLGLSGGGGSMEPMNPHKLATIGGLADAASTYAFLKRQKGKEGNAFLSFTNNHPEATALGALGGLAASKGLTHLVKKFSPKLADALAANLGTLQTSYAIGNLGLTNSRTRSSQAYQNAMTNKVVKGQ